MSYLIPILFLALFFYAIAKKKKPYESFVKGIKTVPPLVLSLFPYLAAMFLLTELCTASGLTDLLVSLLSPVVRPLGIPEEILPLLLLKPFSGSGSTALLSEILSAYGADSFISRCACTCYGSSETIFYVASVYFAGLDFKTGKPILISLFVTFLSTIVACLLVRFL
ncbi:MAG: spore maturation protein [Clostridia bacterium]|nr:spore maturation protein [Clostridia bacterium]